MSCATERTTSCSVYWQWVRAIRSVAVVRLTRVHLKRQWEFDVMWWEKYFISWKLVLLYDFHWMYMPWTLAGLTSMTGILYNVDKSACMHHLADGDKSCWTRLWPKFVVHLSSHCSASLQGWVCRVLWFNASWRKPVLALQCPRQLLSNAFIAQVHSMPVFITCHCALLSPESSLLMKVLTQMRI